MVLLLNLGDLCDSRVVLIQIVYGYYHHVLLRFFFKDVVNWPTVLSSYHKRNLHVNVDIGRLHNGTKLLRKTYLLNRR